MISPVTKDTVKVPDQGQFKAAVLMDHLNDWQEITKDPVTIQAVKGVKLPLRSTPPTCCPTEGDLERRDEDPVVDSSIKELLELGAIQEIPRDTPVFLSKVFTVPKLERGKEYGRRFILNLKVSIENIFTSAQCLYLLESRLKQPLHINRIRVMRDSLHFGLTLNSIILYITL